MFNKRGQELSITTLILIIIGIVVLVLVIAGFTVGFGNLRERLGFIAGGSTVDSFAESCRISVATNAEFSFCLDFKRVRFESGAELLNCQDSRVNLDTAITCDGDPAVKYCTDQRTAKGADYDDAIVVNGKNCTLWGVPKPTA